jgi:OHCU decarboxylase
MEAFRAHPRIGEKRAHGQSDEAAAMSTSEQSAFERTSAGRETMRALNEEYEKRFGHLFIVCASGLAAAEIETQVRSRMTNSPEQEVRVAAEEQRKITRLRLERMLEDQ